MVFHHVVSVASHQLKRTSRANAKDPLVDIEIIAAYDENGKEITDKSEL